MRVKLDTRENVDTKKRVGRPRTRPVTDSPKKPVGRPKKIRFDPEACKEGPGVVSAPPKISSTSMSSVFDVPLVTKNSIPQRLKTDDDRVVPIKYDDKRKQARFSFNATGNYIEQSELYEDDPENISMFEARMSRKSGRGGGKAGTNTRRARWTDGMKMTLGHSINCERDRLRGRTVSGASRNTLQPTRTFCWERVAGM